MTDQTPPTSPDDSTACQRNATAIICYSQCWPCQFGQCYDPPQPHGWADADDRQHAHDTGQPAPDGDCACPCARPDALPAEEPTP